MSKKEEPASDRAEVLRIRAGAILVALAFVFLGAVVGIAIANLNTSQDVVAVVGSVTGVVGTIIGAFFGVQVGSSGKEQAEQGRADAQDLAQRALATLPPDEARSLLGS